MVEVFFNMYCGLRYNVIFGKVYHSVRAGVWIMSYFFIFGTIAAFTDSVFWDLLFVGLLAPQVLFSFTNRLVNEYKRVYNKTNDDLEKLNEERKLKAFNKVTRN